MNTIIKSRTRSFLGRAALFVSALIIGTTLYGAAAHASISPYLSVSSLGNGDAVTVTVNGDPNASILFYYMKSGVGSQVSSLGTTSSSGTFSTTISSSTYGILAGTAVHVTTGGLSGYPSNEVAWPVTSTSNSYSGGLTLSQSSVLLSVGQSSTISATMTSGGTLTMANNSNYAVTNVSFNGSQITFTGNTYGSSTVTICVLGYTTNCPSVFVTVQNAGSAQLSFSQSTITIAQGTTIPVSIMGGNGAYNVFNNSNNSVIQASISGSTINLTALASTGLASVTVCDSTNTICGLLNITIGASTSGTVSFSQTNPTLSVGQGLTLSVYGNSNNSYYVYSNTNTNIVQTSINGAILTLTGITNGTSTITVCSSTGGCGTLTVTVGYNSTGGNIALSQSTLSILTGQNLSVTISGGIPPYSLLTASSSVYQASLSGNVLTVYGSATGSGQVTVCSTSGGCTALTVSVNGVSTGTPSGSSSSSSFLTLSQSSTSLSLGQSSAISVSGGSGIYSIAYNSNPSAVTASINGGAVSVSGLNTGVSVIVVCSSIYNCGALSVGVNTSSMPTNTGTTTTGSTGNGSLSFQFTSFLSTGSTGNEVLELQLILTARGYYSGPVNGNYGPLTAAAVSRYQAAHGIAAVGYVGPSTRYALNTTTN